MKTHHRHIMILLFWLIMAISASAQYSINSVLPQKGDTCNGKFELKTAGSTYPLTIYLMQSVDTLLVREVRYAGIETFDNLCAGQYKVVVKNTYECSKPIDVTVPGCEGSFEIRQVGKADTKYVQSSTGMIEVIAYPGGQYDYKWSNGQSGTKISGLTLGNYTVDVTDQSTGCVSSATFYVSSCYGDSINVIPGVKLGKDTFEINLFGGISANGQNAVMYLMIKNAASSVFRQYIPGEYDVTWKINGITASVNASSLVIPAEDSINVEVTVTNGCFTKMQTKRPLKCNSTDNESMKRFFLKSIIPPCAGSSDGIVSINTLDIGAANGRVTIDGISMPYRSDNTFAIGTVSSGKHKINVFTEGGCNFEFLIDVVPTYPDKTFINYISSKRKCVYGINCKGTYFGKDSLDPVYSLADKGCKVNVFCNAQNVGTISQGIRIAYGAEYYQILLAAYNSGGYSKEYVEPYLNEYSKNESELNCSFISFCPVSLQFYGRLPGVYTKTKSKIVNGCSITDCRPRKLGWIFNPFGKILKYCGLKDIQLPPTISGSSSFGDCYPLNENLTQLINDMRAGRFDYNPNFPQSELRTLLEKFNQLIDIDPKIVCARVTYCAQSLKVLKNDYDIVNCNLGNCQPVKAGMTEDGKTTFYNVTCSNPFTHTETIALKKVCCAFDDSTIDKFVTDTNKILAFQSLNIIKSAGFNYVKPIFKLNGQSNVLDYTLPLPVDANIKYSGEITHMVEDWDNTNTLWVGKSNSSTFDLAFQRGDSVINRTLNFTAGNVTIKKMYQIGTNYFICGIVSQLYGYVNVYYNNVPIANIGSDYYFVIKCDKFGNYVSKVINTTVQTNAVNFFQENSGIIYFSNGRIIQGLNDVLSTILNLDVSTKIPGFQSLLSGSVDPKGKRIFILSGSISSEYTTGEQLQYLYCLVKSGTTYNLSKTRVIGIEGGIKNTTYAQLVSDSLQNSYLVSRVNSTLGIYNSTQTAYSNFLTGNFKDISIIKFDSLLNVKNTYIRPSPEEETLEQVYLSQNVLFFGGIFYGTSVRKLGLHNYYNLTKNPSAPYMTYIYTDQMSTLSSSAATAPIPTLNKAEVKNLNILKATDSNRSINISPNPFNDITLLKLNNQSASEIEIVNNIGRTVAKYSIEGDNSTEVLVNGRNWPAGIYFIRVMDLHGRLIETKKLMKF